MDKLLDDLMREVERWERAYRLLPCDEIRQRLHEARLRLSREQARRLGLWPRVGMIGNSCIGWLRTGTRWYALVAAIGRSMTTACC